MRPARRRRCPCRSDLNPPHRTVDAHANPGARWLHYEVWPLRRAVPPDIELTERARLGDKDAFAALVTRHGDTARRLAERVLGDHDMADDACQEAIMVAMLSLDRLSKPGSL